MTSPDFPRPTTRCPHCRRRFRIDPHPDFRPSSCADYAGRLKRCPGCGQLFAIALANGGAKPELPRSEAPRFSTASWVVEVHAGVTCQERTPGSDSQQQAEPTAAPGRPPTSKPPRRKGTPKPAGETSLPRNLSWGAYMAEAAADLDRLQQAVKLPPLAAAVLKATLLFGRLVISPLDYPLWRAVQQGRMSQGDRVVIQLVVAFLLFRWSRALRKRQDLKDQAEALAQALQHRST
ncbi:MAG TPA: hypothetical protein PKC18_00655 [Lacipirellulaceae bacterium]|nr:hypothetical protein [Lacipirellulaceae bacterium]